MFFEILVDLFSVVVVNGLAVSSDNERVFAEVAYTFGFCLGGGEEDLAGWLVDEKSAVLGVGGVEFVGVVCGLGLVV